MVERKIFLASKPISKILPEKIDNIFYLPLVSIKCIKYEQFYVRHQSGEIELYEDEIDSESIKSQLEL